MSNARLEDLKKEVEARQNALLDDASHIIHYAGYLKGVNIPLDPDEIKPILIGNDPRLPKKKQTLENKAQEPELSNQELNEIRLKVIALDILIKQLGAGNDQAILQTFLNDSQNQKLFDSDELFYSLKSKYFPSPATTSPSSASATSNPADTTGIAMRLASAAQASTASAAASMLTQSVAHLSAAAKSATDEKVPPQATTTPKADAGWLTKIADGLSDAPKNISISSANKNLLKVNILPIFRRAQASYNRGKELETVAEELTALYETRMVKYIQDTQKKRKDISRTDLTQKDYEDFVAYLNKSGHHVHRMVGLILHEIHKSFPKMNLCKNSSSNVAGDEKRSELLAASLGKLNKPADKNYNFISTPVAKVQAPAAAQPQATSEPANPSGTSRRPSRPAG